MSMRSFTGNDGQLWSAWVVRSGSAGKWLGVPDAWLVFQNEGDTERRRMLVFPADWEELTDQRLDLLRRVAEPVTLYAHRHSPAGGINQAKIPPDDEL